MDFKSFGTSIMQFPTSFPDTPSTPHTPICSEILYGLFVGDALGAQNEFKGRGHATPIPVGTKYKAIEGRNLPYGGLTDDGAMALATLYALNNSNGISLITAREFLTTMQKCNIVWRDYSTTAQAEMLDTAKAVMDSYAAWLTQGVFSNGQSDVGVTVEREVLEYINTKQQYPEDLNIRIGEKLRFLKNNEYNGGNGTIMKQAAITYFVLNKYAVEDEFTEEKLVEVLDYSSALSVIISRLTHSARMPDLMVLLLNAIMVLNFYYNKQGILFDRFERIAKIFDDCREMVFDKYCSTLPLSSLDRTLYEQLTETSKFLFVEKLPEQPKIKQLFAKILGKKQPAGKVLVTQDRPNNMPLFFKRFSYAQLRNGGYCFDTMTSALWCFLAGDSFEDGLYKAINLFGDADTIAAVYGQIAASFYGLSDIPECLITELHDIPMINFVLSNSQITPENKCVTV